MSAQRVAARFAAEGLKIKVKKFPDLTKDEVTLLKGLAFKDGGMAELLTWQQQKSKTVKDAVAFLGYLGNELVGWAYLDPQLKVRFGVYVDREYRKQGIATALLNKAKSHPMAKAAPVEVYPHDKPSRNFYKTKAPDWEPGVLWASVVTRHASEVLSKPWLMGVRKGWLQVMSPHINDWDDVDRAFLTVATFVKNLTYQVFYVRRGPYSGSMFMEDGKKLLAILGQVSAEAQDLWGRAKHWRSVAEKSGLPGFPIESAEHMLNLYKTDFAEATKVSIEKGGRGKWTQVGLTDLMDKALKILREDAQRIKDHDEKNPSTPFEAPAPSYKEFDLHGMKVVIDDGSVLPSEINDYIKLFDEAYQRLKQKGFGSAWYGTIFVRCDSCGGVNSNGADLGVGGDYHINKDTVQVYERPNKHVVSLIAHELGHRFWFKQMSQTQRAKFESFINVQKRKKPLTEKYFTILQSKVLVAKRAVEEAVEPVRKALKDFSEEKAKWFKDPIDKYNDVLFRAGDDARQNLLTAMHKPGADATLNSDVRSTFDDALRASAELEKHCRGLSTDILATLHNTPEPAQAPKSHDKYWWDVFVPIRKAWIETANELLEQAVAAALIYIDFSVQAYNENEKAKADKNQKDWQTERDEDTRSVLPVTPYGGSNIDEAFAEVFRFYVMGEDMTRDQIESFKSVLKTARAIPVDKQSILRFTEFLEKKLAEIAAKHNGPFGSRVLGHWPYDLRAVDDTTITTYVRLEARPTTDTGFVSEGGVGFAKGTPVVVAFINGTLDADAVRRGSETHIVRFQLYKLLLHEFTHVADKYTPGVGNDLTEEQLRAHPEVYYNNPSELHAFLQEVVDQTSDRFAYYEKFKKHFGQRAFTTLLNLSDTWKEVSPHWTEKNRQKVIKAVYQALQDWEKTQMKVALEIKPEAIDRWKKDLRVMTKIYKTVDFEADSANLERWDEAVKLFRTFKENFERWVYKLVLPKVEKGKEPYLYKDIQKQAWDALFTIRTDELFPTQHGGGSGHDRMPAPWELRNTRDKFITRYNKAFNTALKTIEDYLNDQKGADRFEDQNYDIAGMNVLVQGYGRKDNDDDLDKALSKLRDCASSIVRSGFKKAIDGVRLVVDFDPKSGEGLTAAQYSPAEDRMKLYPLGMAGSGFTGFEGTFVHEMGHRYWFKSMSGQARAHWDDVMTKNLVKIEPSDVAAFVKLVDIKMDHSEMLGLVNRAPVDEIQRAKFRELTRINGYDVASKADYQERLERLMVGDPVLLEDISEYAASGGPIEAFAEAFKAYVLKGPRALGPMTRTLFETVVATGGVKLATFRIAERSKKVKLGYRIVDTRTGEAYTKIVPRKDDKLRDQAKALTSEGKSVGIQTVEVHVPESWKKGDDLEPYVPKDVLEGLKQASIKVFLGDMSMTPLRKFQAALVATRFKTTSDDQMEVGKWYKHKHVGETYFLVKSKQKNGGWAGSKVVFDRARPKATNYSVRPGGLGSNQWSEIKNSDVPEEVKAT